MTGRRRLQLCHWAAISGPAGEQLSARTGMGVRVWTFIMPVSAWPWPRGKHGVAAPTETTVPKAGVLAIKRHLSLREPMCRGTWMTAEQLKVTLEGLVWGSKGAHRTRGRVERQGSGLQGLSAG